MSINTSISHVSMACIPTFHPAWTTIPAQPQGPVIGIIKAIQDMQGFDYLPPPGYEFAKPPLGTGGCGKVYLAKNCSTGYLYAVKCVKISDPYTHLMARALWNEVKILNYHPHQHIITCHGAWHPPTDSSIRYLFLEYMDMGSVKHLYSNGANTINERFVRECIQHVLAGLVHLHDLSIIHRDLKGDNILKDSKGLYKIADFGLSKRCNIDSASGGYCLMTPGVGTPTHMAPELKDPTLNVPYDMNMMKVDIWSLGCLVLEISSCGTFTVSVVNQHAEYNLPPIITPQCTHFIQWCLQVNPINRPTSRMLLNHDWFKILL